MGVAAGAREAPAPQPDGQLAGRHPVAFAVLLHALVWLVLLAVPIYMAWENPQVFGLAKRLIVMIAALAAVFYANYLWAIDHLFFRRQRLPLFALFNVALFFAVGYLSEALRDFLADLRPADLVPPPRPPKAHDPDIHKLFVFKNLILYLLALTGSLGARFLSLAAQMETRRRSLENETLTSELRLLKYQLQPHFFFNSLNNIYSLIDTAPADAQKAVYALSKMMRYILYDCSNATIPLGQEVSLLTNYASLMRLGLTDEAHVSLHFPPGDNDCRLPPLLLIPLLENAFKHGVGPRGEAEIVATLSLDGQRLTFQVDNVTYDPLDDPTLAAQDIPVRQSGIGLQNLRKRLAILYGGAASLDMERDDEQRRFSATLRITLDGRTPQ